MRQPGDRILAVSPRARAFVAFLLAAIVCFSALRVSQGSPMAASPGSSQSNGSSNSNKAAKGAGLRTFRSLESHHMPYAETLELRLSEPGTQPSP